MRITSQTKIDSQFHSSIVYFYIRSITDFHGFSTTQYNTYYVTNMNSLLKMNQSCFRENEN